MTNEELSTAVARRLFGKVVQKRTVGLFKKHEAWRILEWNWHWYAPEPYASDHNAAFLVVAEMRKRGWLAQIIDCLELEKVAVTFTKWGPHIQESSLVSLGEEPRAICEAALAALDSE